MPGLTSAGGVWGPPRLQQRFDAVAVEAFTGGDGFGGQTAVQGGFEEQYELAAEFLGVQRRGQLVAVTFQNLNPFFHDLAQFGIDLGFIRAMAAWPDEGRGTAHKAAVFRDRGWFERLAARMPILTANPLMTGTAHGQA